MSNQPEIIVYDPGVYQWEITDPVQGAVGGIANTPLLNLSNRTAWLKSQVDALNIAIALKAPLDSPPFTGSPTVPDVAAGDNTTKIADTKFVQTARSGIAVVSTTGGNTTLAQAIWGCGVLVVSGTLTSNATLTFPAAQGSWVIENLTTGAFTLIAKTAATAGVTIPQAGALSIVWDGTNLIRQATVLTRNKEVLASDLADTGVSAGSYTKANITLTVDGRVTAASNGGVSFSDVTGGLGYVPPSTQIVVSSVSFFFTVPANVTRVWAGILGGGAGAAGSTLSPLAIGGGGGGGEYREGWISVTPGQVIFCSIGAGGPGGAPGFGGSNGGASSFGAFITANGGQAGTIGGVGPGGSGGQGGSGGDFSVPGSCGGDGSIGGGVTMPPYGGMGGLWGASIRAGTFPTAANGDAYAFGSGGAASYYPLVGGASVGGGKGTTGRIVVRW